MRTPEHERGNRSARAAHGQGRAEQGRAGQGRVGVHMEHYYVIRVQRRTFVHTSAMSLRTRGCTDMQ